MSKKQKETKTVSPASNWIAQRLANLLCDGPLSEEMRDHMLTESEVMK